MNVIKKYQLISLKEGPVSHYRELIGIVAGSFLRSTSGKTARRTVSQ